MISMGHNHSKDPKEHINNKQQDIMKIQQDIMTCDSKLIDSFI